MGIKTKLFSILGLIVMSLAIVTGNALAKKNDDGTRPGWGWGDKNHTHTGPPGHSVFPGPSVLPDITVESNQEVEVESEHANIQVIVGVQVFLQQIKDMFANIKIGSHVAISSN